MDPHALNAKRARGFGSRLLVLPEAFPDGWRLEKRSDKYCVWFDEKRKRYKSSKEGTCVISFDLNRNRYEIGQVKHRSQALLLMNTSCVYPLCRIVDS